MKAQHHPSFTVYRCRRCGQLFYPRHERCPLCRGREIEEYPVSGEGRLIAYTKLHIPPAGIEKKPLTLGIVELPEGVRAMGQIMAEEPRIGMKLKPTWGELRRIGGKQHQGIRFEPVE